MTPRRQAWAVPVLRARHGSAALLGFWLACWGAEGATPSYRMEPLPVPHDCQSYALWHGLASNDRAIGVVTCDDFATQRAVLWDRGAPMELSGLDGPSTYAYGLDARGRVVGTAETADMYDDWSHVSRPVTWDDGRPRDLGTLGGILGGVAAVNAKGVMVGVCQGAEVDPRLGAAPLRPCAWEDGAVRDLGGLGGPQGWAYDVNAQGWIAGSSDTPEELPSGLGYVHHAFVVDGREIRDLGTLGGVESLAMALNSHGDVVGWSLLEPGGAGGPSAKHAFLWRDGSMHDLGTLGDSYAVAMDINDRGQIVGTSRFRTPRGALVQHATLWDGATLIDLNDVVENLGDWTLLDATAIDDAGRILASAYRPGEWRVVLLARAASSVRLGEGSTGSAGKTCQAAE